MLGHLGRVLFLDQARANLQLSRRKLGVVLINKTDLGQLPFSVACELLHVLFGFLLLLKLFWGLESREVQRLVAAWLVFAHRLQSLLNRVQLPGSKVDLLGSNFVPAHCRIVHAVRTHTDELRA